MTRDDFLSFISIAKGCIKTCLVLCYRKRTNLYITIFIFYQHVLSIMEEIQWRINIWWILMVINNNNTFYFHSWSIFLNSTLIKDHNPIKCNTNHDNDIPLKTSSFIKHVSRLIQYDLVFNVAWSWYIILQ